MTSQLIFYLFPFLLDLLNKIIILMMRMTVEEVSIPWRQFQFQKNIKIDSRKIKKKIHLNSAPCYFILAHNSPYKLLLFHPVHTSRNSSFFKQYLQDITIIRNIWLPLFAYQPLPHLRVLYFYFLLLANYPFPSNHIAKYDSTISTYKSQLLSRRFNFNEACKFFSSPIS